MVEFVLASGEHACEALAFPGAGWWILHVIAIVVLLAVGFLCGRRCAMKRIAMFLIVAIAVQAVAAGICRAQRKGDPKPDDLAKIKAAAPKKATAKPAKPRKMGKSFASP